LREEIRQITRPFARRKVIGPRRDSKDISLALLAWAQFLAAFLDAIENYALIRVLLGSTENIWPALARLCAGPKFLIVTLGLLYIICGRILIFLIKAKRPHQNPN